MRRLRNLQIVSVLQKRSKTRVFATFGPLADDYARIASSFVKNLSLLLSSAWRTLRSAWRCRSDQGGQA